MSKPIHCYITAYSRANQIKGTPICTLDQFKQYACAHPTRKSAKTAVRLLEGKYPYPEWSFHRVENEYCPECESEARDARQAEIDAAIAADQKNAIRAAADAFPVISHEFKVMTDIHDKLRQQSNLNYRAITDIQHTLRGIDTRLTDMNTQLVNISDCIASGLDVPTADPEPDMDAAARLAALLRQIMDGE